MPKRIKPGVKFCVISPTAFNRRWFTTEAQATEHATRIADHSELLVVEARIRVSPTGKTSIVERQFSLGI